MHNPYTGFLDRLETVQKVQSVLSDRYKIDTCIPLK